MIRNVVRFAVILAAFAASAAFADIKAVANKYTALPYAKSRTAPHAETYIPVFNYTSNIVYASVPGLSVTLFSGQGTVFSHETYRGDTLLTLQDPYGVVFYNQYVCRYATVSIQGRPGYYQTTVDRRYC